MVINKYIKHLKEKKKIIKPKLTKLRTSTGLKQKRIKYRYFFLHTANT